MELIRRVAQEDHQARLNSSLWNASRDSGHSIGEKSGQNFGMATVTIDNRGLQPPEPMVRILSGLEGMSDGDEMVALMDREPIMLYPQLERRGWAWNIEESHGDGCYRLTIRRAEG